MSAIKWHRFSNKPTGLSSALCGKDACIPLSPGNSVVLSDGSFGLVVDILPSSQLPELKGSLANDEDGKTPIPVASYPFTRMGKSDGSRADGADGAQDKKKGSDQGLVSLIVQLYKIPPFIGDAASLIDRGAFPANHGVPEVLLSLEIGSCSSVEVITVVTILHCKRVHEWAGAATGMANMGQISRAMSSESTCIIGEEVELQEWETYTKPSSHLAAQLDLQRSIQSNLSSIASGSKIAQTASVHGDSARRIFNMLENSHYTRRQESGSCSDNSKGKGKGKGRSVPPMTVPSLGVGGYHSLVEQPVRSVEYFFSGEPALASLSKTTGLCSRFGASTFTGVKRAFKNTTVGALSTEAEVSVLESVKLKYTASRTDGYSITSFATISVTECRGKIVSKKDGQPATPGGLSLPDKPTLQPLLQLLGDPFGATAYRLDAALPSAHGGGAGGPGGKQMADNEDEDEERDEPQGDSYCVGSRGAEAAEEAVTKKRRKERITYDEGEGYDVLPAIWGEPASREVAVLLVPGGSLVGKVIACGFVEKLGPRWWKGLVSGCTQAGDYYATFDKDPAKWRWWRAGGRTGTKHITMAGVLVPEKYHRLETGVDSDVTAVDMEWVLLNSTCPLPPPLPPSEQGGAGGGGAASSTSPVLERDLKDMTWTEQYQVLKENGWYWDYAKEVAAGVYFRPGLKKEDFAEYQIDLHCFTASDRITSFIKVNTQEIVLARCVWDNGDVGFKDATANGRFGNPAPALTSRHRVA